MKSTTVHLIFHQDTLLMKRDADILTLPTGDDISSSAFSNSTISGNLDNLEGHKLMTDSQFTYMLYVTEDTDHIPDNWHFQTLRDTRDYHLNPLYPIAVQGLQLLNWKNRHKFCGVCGSQFGLMNPDRSLKCPECGNWEFPQMSVAVITAIYKDGKILLAHNANFPDNLYSLVAGFVEIGETLESAVHREIEEEVGIKVKNVQYFGSQPWPFPNSLMVGFIAEYESGEINTDDIEIEDAKWFTPDTFPDIPHEYSIARKIIESYRGSTLV